MAGKAQPLGHAGFIHGAGQAKSEAQPQGKGEDAPQPGRIRIRRPGLRAARGSFRAGRRHAEQDGSQAAGRGRGHEDGAGRDEAGIEGQCQPEAKKPGWQKRQARGRGDGLQLDLPGARASCPAPGGNA